MLVEILKLSVVCWVVVFLMSPGMIFNFYWKLIDRLPDNWYKPLGGCLMCFTGQVATWYYLIAHFHNYSLFDHIVFVCSSIFFVMLIDKIIDYESENN